jgi:hypothetical protein
MPSDEITELHNKLGTEIWAIKEILARLLAFAACESPDVEWFLANFLKTLDVRLECLRESIAEQNPELADAFLEHEEGFRANIKWHIEFARLYSNHL